MESQNNNIPNKVTPAKDKDDSKSVDPIDGFNNLATLIDLGKQIETECMNETDTSNSNESERPNIHASK